MACIERETGSGNVMGGKPESFVTILAFGSGHIAEQSASLSYIMPWIRECIKIGLLKKIKLTKLSFLHFV